MGALVGLGIADGLAPEDGTVLEVEGKDHENETVGGVDVVVGARRLLGDGQRLTLFHGSREEDPFPPDNGR